MKQKVLTIIGARPQFIKASVVSMALKDVGISEVMLHTGQHFDANMSEIFFSQLGIPRPKYMLNINSGSHGEMTGRMLEQIESIIDAESPSRVMVFGDTNSTIAGALAAAKLHIPVVHVEAGLRSYDRKMPEEVNRVLTDNLSDVLFCPTPSAVENLRLEGIVSSEKVRVEISGDVMQDSHKFYGEKKVRPDVVKDGVQFILATIHRAENTDNLKILSQLVDGLNQLNDIANVILPVHPRMKKAMERAGLKFRGQAIDPVGYFEMLWLLDSCGLVVTDSGGVQKEAYFSGKHCITLRNTTEWVELLNIDANILVGADTQKLLQEATRRFGGSVNDDHSLYGGGGASARIADTLMQS